MAVTLGTAAAGTRLVTSVGNRKFVWIDVTGDTSYPTGGSSLTPAQLGLRRIIYANTAKSTGGIDFTYDRPNNKLMTFSGATQTTNATNQSAITVRMEFVGV